MKMKFEVEVEVPEAKDLSIWEDAGKDESDYTQEELDEYRENYALELKDSVENFIFRQLDFSVVEDEFLEWLDDCQVEGWDSASDYGVKIKVTRLKDD